MPRACTTRFDKQSSAPVGVVETCWNTAIIRQPFDFYTFIPVLEAQLIVDAAVIIALQLIVALSFRASLPVKMTLLQSGIGTYVAAKKPGHVETTRIDSDIIYIHCYIVYVVQVKQLHELQYTNITLQLDFNHDHAVTAAHPLLAGLGFSWSSGFRSHLLGKAVKNLMKRPKLRPKVQEIVKRFDRFLAKQLAAILGMTAFFISASTKLEVVGVNLFEPLAAGNVPQSARVSHTNDNKKHMSQSSHETKFGSYHGCCSNMTSHLWHIATSCQLVFSLQSHSFGMSPVQV